MNNKLWDFTGHYNINLPINIMEIGDEYCDLEYYINRENSQIYSFEYILSGDHCITINGEQLIASQGDIILLRKNSKHSYKCHTTPCHKIWTVFDGTLVSDLIQAYIPNNMHIFHCPLLLDEFSSIINISKLHNKNYNKILSEISSSIHRILIGINIDSKSRATLSITDKIKAYIDKNICKPFSLSNISSKFNYSNNHIIILFKNCLGITPNRYYIDKKIEIACTYLRTSNYSLNTISENLGFADQHYFSNSFKKKMGMTPSEYKRKAISEK